MQRWYTPHSGVLLFRAVVTPRHPDSRADTRIAASCTVLEDMRDLCVIPVCTDDSERQQ